MSGLHKFSTIKHYSMHAEVENWLSSKCGKLIKNYIFPAFHFFMHIYSRNKPAKFEMVSLKAVGCVDFT